MCRAPPDFGGGEQHQRERKPSKGSTTLAADPLGKARQRERKTSRGDTPLADDDPRLGNADPPNMLSQEGGDGLGGQPQQRITTPRFIKLLAAITIVILYPLTVIPAFFAGTTQTKLWICLGLHPVLLEAAEAFGRGSDAAQITADMNSGVLTMEQAETRVVQIAAMSFPIKQQMAMFRRLMLLSMGDSSATLFAVVAASIEESVTRGFLVEFDCTIRRVRGLPELKGDSLTLQRLVWMCDANQSAIAELNAILVSSFAQLLLERHAQLLALGYTVSAPLDAVVVLVQLMIELTLEVGVDMMAMWAETEHGIPVTHYFRLVRSSKYFILHSAVGIAATALALYSFIRHPNFA